MRTVLKWDGGLIEFDAVVSEAPEHRARITDYPVERGSNPVDHVRLEPDWLRLRVVVSNDPARGANDLTHLDGSVEGRGVQIPVSEPLIPGSDKAGLPTSFAGIPLSHEINVTASVRTWTGKVQRVTNVYSELKNALATARVFTVATDIGDFDSMVIAELLPERTSRNSRSLPMTIALRKLSFSELSQRTELALLRELNAANARSKLPRDSGKQATAPADSATNERADSLLYTLFN